MRNLTNHGYEPMEEDAFTLLFNSKRSIQKFKLEKSFVSYCAKNLTNECWWSINNYFNLKFPCFKRTFVLSEAFAFKPTKEMICLNYFNEKCFLTRYANQMLMLLSSTRFSHKRLR